jgi:L-asparaginase
MHNITLISTGGTIEKTYDERSGTLTNARSIVPRMLAHLKLVETTINTVQLLSKDSLDLTDADRDRIADTVAVLGAAEDCDGIVILHGTDTLATTGELLAARFDPPPVPVILTGAMRPYEMKRSDALQNLNESLFASGVLEPGVYAVMHGRALKFPGVVKDYDLGTFVRATEGGRDEERS